MLTFVKCFKGEGDRMMWLATMELTTADAAEPFLPMVRAGLRTLKRARETFLVES